MNQNINPYDAKVQYATEKREDEEKRRKKRLLREKQDTFKTVDRDLQGIKRRVDHLEREIRTQKGSIDGVHAKRIQEYEKKIEKNQNEYKQLMEVLEKKREQREKLQQQLHSKIDELTQKKGEYNELLSKHEALKQEISSLQK